MPLLLIQNKYFKGVAKLYDNTLPNTLPIAGDSSVVHVMLHYLPHVMILTL